MNFETEAKKLFDRIGENCYMVLATCDGNYPMRSTMTCLVFDGCVWMQTDKKFAKYTQILNNPQTALVKGATQLEGKTYICGHPFEEQNRKFCELIKKYHPESYEMYSKVDTEVVLKFVPEKAVDWLYEAGSSDIYNYDFTNKTVTVQKYKNGKDK